MANVEYGYEKNLGSVGFDDAIARVTEALKQEGFGVLTEIDVKSTLKTKIDVDVDDYKILGACNPKLAHQALQALPEVGLLLPCNVVVRATGQGTVVHLASPKAMFAFIDDPKVAPVATEADARIRRVLDAL